MSALRRACLTAVCSAALAAPLLPGAATASAAVPPPPPPGSDAVRGLIVKYRPAPGAALRRAGALVDRPTTVALPRPVDVATARRAAAALAADPRVEYAEPDLRLHAAGYPGTRPDDPYLSRQWALVGPRGVLPARAWARTHGSGVVVAVLDTGITRHPDLAGRTVGGYDMVSDPALAVDGGGRDGDPSDPGDAYAGEPSSWHGTHVAGIVAAAGGNRTGVSGVAPLARVQPVRVLGSGGGDLSDVEDGIYWAAGLPVAGAPRNATPARVVNLSLGGTARCPQSLQAAIDAALAAGTSVVVAAGNEAAAASSSVPGNCRGVVTVAASDEDGALARYSNRGGPVDLAAPGGAADGTGGILSTLNDGTTRPGAPGYAFYAGTSMATPQVSGAVALLLSLDPALRPAEVAARLRASARPSAPCPATRCGAGLLDAGALVGTVPASPVEARYARLGGERGALGAATSDEHAVRGGRARDYARGRIYTSPGTGTHAVTGATLLRYLQAGGPGGPLGLPRSDGADEAGTRRTTFRGGRVYASPAGVHVVHGAVLGRYLALGSAAGPLGAPTSDESDVPGGRRAGFVHGQVFWGPGLGAHALQGPVLGAYLRSGGAAGPLGLPLSDSSVAGPGTVEFQHGTVRYAGGDSLSVSYRPA